MTVSYSWLNAFFKKPLPKPEKLAEVLTLHSFENEAVSELKNDWVLDIDVLPDRAGDCLSHLGIARECAAILGLSLVEPVIKFKESPTRKIADYLEVEVRDKDCKRYCSRVISGVKIQSSPRWMQEKLIACGVNPINNVVDITNFVMLEIGQPLHVFDHDKISGGKIIVKKAKPGEKISLLSGTDVILDKTMLTISDAEGAMAIAGIKGGKRAEIDGNTTNIVIESANFTPKLISQTARKLNIRTDASVRFEHNLDPNLASFAIDRAVTLMAEYAGGEVVNGIIDVYPEKVKPIKLKLETDLLKRILGVTIPQKELESIVKKLGFGLLSSSTRAISVEVPTWRQDVVIKENLIEEIGRIYGYNKINPVLPCNQISPAIRNDALYWQYRIKESLKDIGWSEMYSYSFIGDEEKEMFSLEPVEVVNPVSVFFKYIRPSLLPQTMKALRENLKSFKDVRIYEIGKAFIKEDKKTIENRRVTGAISLNKVSIQEQFQKLKGEMEYIMREMGVREISYAKTGLNSVWEKGNAVAMICNGIRVGEFGQYSIDITEKMGLPETSMGFDIDLDESLKIFSETKEYKRISYHPPAMRDISGIVREEMPDNEIVKTIESAILEDEAIDIEAGVTDVYRKGIEDGQKSVTIRITLQHAEKTMNTSEIDTSIRKIINNLSEKIGWEERK